MNRPNSRRDKVLSIITEDFDIARGAPAPLGSSLRRGGINFAIYSKNAAAVTLVLFIPGEEESILEFPLDPKFNRTGHIWHALITGLDPGIRYGYRVAGGPEMQPPRHRFNPEIVLIDPYAKAFSGAPRWGEFHRRNGGGEGGSKSNSRRSLVVDDQFDWGVDQPLNTPLSQSIIYEVHLRGFTRHPSSGVRHPGTFRGMMEKIPYLKELGVTAVELLPINEFEEIEDDRRNPLTGERLLNYWGYNSLGFFAPKSSYAFQGSNSGPVHEFKTLVKALHEAGIEIILDVVFNHTAEGNEKGKTSSFKGLDNAVYYMLDPHSGAYMNYSGCGNTMNCNHPVVRDLILDCLRYWVTEMHVDGFRFDLASILGRGQDGSVLSNPPLIERIAYDPVLANTKIIAEAWDAAGLYQVGSFPAWGRWAEWNGRFRDDLRRFVKGDAGMVPALAARLAGSPDLYQSSGRAPWHSINLVTSHDGFTLADLVSYNEKHNLENGENNRDGTNENFSWNCGAEGPTSDPLILELRQRQMKNLAALLLLSHGVPMILGGDEFGRSQNGNNNAYCQDNPISWFNWELTQAQRELQRFLKMLIAQRRHFPHFRPAGYSAGEGHPYTWHGVRVGQPDWGENSRSLAMQLHGVSGAGRAAAADLYLIANAYWEPLEFELPPPARGHQWRRIMDTALPSPGDILAAGEEQALSLPHSYRVAGRSVVLLVSR